ncbi:MAG: hypothetical protein HC853_07675 [Anaerolineae bacterium]|nr:hypothetical protein [Anaerolineae bacterium]
MNDLPGAQRDAIQPSLRALFAFRKPSFAQIIWLVLSVLLFAALARWSMHDFPLAEMWRGLQSANMPMLGLAALTLFLSQSLRLLRWQRLLSTEAPLPVATTAKALMDGQMINWLSPIRVGDVWRVWQIASQANPPRSVIWAAVTICWKRAPIRWCWPESRWLSSLPPCRPMPTTCSYARVWWGWLACC